MALYTRTQFLKEMFGLAGDKRSLINQALKRGKMVQDPSKLFDSEHPVNLAFVKNYKPRAKRVRPVAVKKKVVAPVMQYEQSNSTPVYKQLQNEDEEIGDEGETSKFNLEIKLKELDAEKKEEEIRKLKLQNQKLLGELVPVEFVQQMWVIHFKSISDKTFASMDRFLTEVCMEQDVEQDVKIRYRERVIERINKAIEEAKEQSKSEMNTIILEHSNKRGKGERK